MPVIAKMEVDHNPDVDYHLWVLLPGWKGAPVTVTRDSLARKTKHAWRAWLVLICNNSECPGRCIVNAGVIEAMAETAVPVPARKEIE
jgi:hypothetical protein